jgi:nucleotidyltransferase/DNA polymerase involved in DNA repair
MAVACLLMPQFALGCELLSSPNLFTRTSPLAIVEGRVIEQVSPAASRHGVRPGQRLQEALSFCPYLVTFEARPAVYESRLATILRDLEQVSPAVEPGSFGVIFIDLHGLDRHYPDPGSMEEAILACAPAALRPRIGIGSGKFPALVAARQAKPGQSHRIPSRNVAAALSSVSVDVLPVSHEVRRRMRLLGLETLGSLAALPRSSVAMQFGPEGCLAWDLASGNDSAPVRYRQGPQTIPTRQAFDPPLVSRDVIVAVVERLVDSVAGSLSREHQAARQVSMHAITERGQTWNQQVTFKNPRAEKATLWAAIKPLVEAADLPGPVVELGLELTGLTPVGGFQTDLWVDTGKRQQQRLQAALRQLKTRYGYCPVGHVVKVEPWSRIPERRAAIIAFDP